jgi:hypothetical protein
MAGTIYCKKYHRNPELVMNEYEISESYIYAIS